MPAMTHPLSVSHRGLQRKIRESLLQLRNMENSNILIIFKLESWNNGATLEFQEPTSYPRSYRSNVLVDNDNRTFMIQMRQLFIING